MLLRVLSYNVHKLFNLTRTRYFLADLKEVLDPLDLDLVFLQEIRGEHPQAAGGSFDGSPLEHLADELWDYFVYGKNAVYSSGSHGNAILSKYPFKDWKNFDISNSRFQKRSLLVGIPEIPDFPEIELCCTHLDLTQRGRDRQLGRMLEIVRGRCGDTKPVLFCGDFNDWNGRISRKLVLEGFRTGTASPTFPSFLPLLTLDRVFYRGVDLRELRVLDDSRWRRFSDHLPIYSEFFVGR